MSVDLSLDQDGGLLKEILTPGLEGEDEMPRRGDTVLVHYVGTLADTGDKFDSSRDRGEKFRFNLGKGEVIKGWDLGVASMTRGEKAKFIIRSDYAYGENGSPPKIPPKATLIFEVELFDFFGEDISKNNDRSVVKRILEVGEGLDHPNEDSVVEVQLKGLCDGKVFDERESLTFTLGEGEESNIPAGVERAIEKMKKSEKCQVQFNETHGFTKASIAQGMPSQGAFKYDIWLKTFERAKESWQMDGEQKLEQAKLLKERGTQFFHGSKYDLAAKKYNKIVEFLEHEISLNGDSEEARRSLLQAARLNLAMCHLKKANWIEARNICDKVIEENQNLAKAFFRRGEAQFNLNDHELARKDFMRVLEIDPENKAAANKVALCNKAVKQQKQQEAKTYANMFEKFARIDEKKAADQRRREKPLEINEWSKSSATGNDPNKMKVSGDVEMDLDLNQAIQADQES